jgi:hypothetical protein
LVEGHDDGAFAPFGAAQNVLDPDLGRRVGKQREALVDRSFGKEAGDRLALDDLGAGRKFGGKACLLAAGDEQAAEPPPLVGQRADDRMAPPDPGRVGRMMALSAATVVRGAVVGG